MSPGRRKKECISLVPFEVTPGYIDDEELSLGGDSPDENTYRNNTRQFVEVEKPEEITEHKQDRFTFSLDTHYLLLLPLLLILLLAGYIFHRRRAFRKKLAAIDAADDREAIAMRYGYAVCLLRHSTANPPEGASEAAELNQKALFSTQEMTPEQRKDVDAYAMKTMETYTASGKSETYTTPYNIFTPSGAQAQYAICSPIMDEYGTIYFKNDSAYLMAVGSTIERIEVTKLPDKTTYNVKDTFDPTGMQVTAYYANGKTRDITAYVTWSETPLTANDTDFQITFPYAMYQNRENSDTLEMEYGVHCDKPMTTLTLTIEDTTEVKYGDVNGDGKVGIPLRQDQPAVVAFPYDPAAVHPQSWPGGEENQPRSERHRPGQQSGECFPAIHQLPTDILYADNLDDFSAGAGIRFHAFPGQPAPWPDGFLYLPLRQPGQGVCDYPVHLHHPDGHGRDTGSQQDVVQPQNHLAAIKRNWHDSGRRLSGALPAAPWAGALDRVSVPQSQRKIKGLPFRHANQLMKRETFICLYL